MTLLCKSEHDEDDENQERALTVSFLPSCSVLFDGVDDGVMRKREDRADPSLELVFYVWKRGYPKRNTKKNQKRRTSGLTWRDRWEKRVTIIIEEKRGQRTKNRMMIEEGRG